MGQLEQLGHAPRSANGSNSARTSPMLSPSSLPSELESTSSRERVAPAVEEWMAKARERIDDFISVAGSAPISYVQDDADGSDDEYEDSEYEFAIVDSYGEVTTPEVAASRRDSAPNSVPTKKRTYSGKLATLPSEAAPYGLMANLSLKAHPRRLGSQGEVMQSPEEDSELSIANDDFFRKRSVLEASPGPDAERPRETAVFEYPAILARGIITPDIAESLFSIYFGTMNQSVSLLDPVLYTAPRTCVRSPFLFTVICALASRFHHEHLKVYPQLMRFAHLAAGTALISGTKTVDMCHAFILLALYPMPTKRWEDDRSWIFLGTAIRIAMDLNLQYPNTAKPQNENHAREMLNRTRLWINCYNLDRSMGSQYGKAPVINQADYTATHTHDWWRSSPYNLQNFDIHLCAYNADLRALSGFIRKVYNNPDHPMGLNKDVDLEQLSMESDDEIQALQREWMEIIEQTDMTDSQNRFRAGLLRLAWSYARLAVLSYGFQHAFGRTNADENPFLMRCFTAAKDVVASALDGLSQPDQKLYLRHGPEAQKVFVTFAASFLVKLLQPKFSHYFDYDRRVEIHGLVTRVIDFLSSPDIAVDDQHGPKLHARFLKGLLASPLAQVTQVRRASSQSKSSHNSPPAAASSPESTTGMPTPATAATSFNKFTPINPFAQPAPTMGTATGGTADFNLEDMFNPPLQYDAAIFERMQELPAQWSDIAGMSTLPEQMMPETAEVRGSGEVDWFTQLQSLSAQTPQSAYGQYWSSQ
ncbi:hypothetical protein K525DRAFT_222833 [Schizophyllum commune Loenen D]|nr:hypothetical protein K525DRAFT_222833 [Schizophyllum commune Loenen D]